MIIANKIIVFGNNNHNTLGLLRSIGEAGLQPDLILSVFRDEHSADNLMQYMKTMFVRFLLSQVVLTQNIAKSSFQFVPLQDFSHPWTDEMLYKKYNLTEEEIAFIESMIRPME